MNATKDNREQNKQEYRPKETDEVFVVPLADTGSYPRAVVVQSFYAASTRTTMYSPGWSVDIAC